MKILSIQVGKPRTVSYQGQDVETGIFKNAVKGPVWLGLLNLDGDGQADLRVHGGRDKALYVYSNDIYSEWKRLRPNDDFEYGAMGENFTMESVDESHVFLGDTYEVGTAVVQVTQPRFPCFKLGIKFGDPTILKQFMKVNRPGVYFRVLQEGIVEAGDTFKLKSQEKVRVSVTEIFNLNKRNTTPARAREILQIKDLTEVWRHTLSTF